MRKKLFVLLASVIVIHFLFVYAKSNPVGPVVAVPVTETVKDYSDPVNTTLSLYDSLHLAGIGLSKQAFDYAIKGYNYFLASGKLHNDGVLSIVDFSQPSSKKRLYIIDVKNGKLLFNTYVSHGRNSGREMAREFSNAAESNKSSLGFYLTGDTYIGKHGYSMRLLGEEKGINDNANSRAIVMHSAAYVTEAAIKAQGFIGRSLGCPAIMESLHRPVIEKIKNGSCFFMYSPDKYYTANSSILKKLA